jgi:hypothetical protein
VARGHRVEPASKERLALTRFAQVVELKKFYSKKVFRQTGSATRGCIPPAALAFPGPQVHGLEEQFRTGEQRARQDETRLRNAREKWSSTKARLTARLTFLERERHEVPPPAATRPVRVTLWC